MYACVACMRVFLLSSAWHSLLPNIFATVLSETLDIITWYQFGGTNNRHYTYSAVQVGNWTLEVFASNEASNLILSVACLQVVAC